VCFQERESKSNTVGAINVVKACTAFKYREVWDRLRQSCFADRTSRFNKPRKMGTFKQRRQPTNHRRRCRQPPRQQRMSVAGLPDDSDISEYEVQARALSDEESQPPEPPESPRLLTTLRPAAIRAAARVAAAALPDNSSSDSSIWESPPLELPELSDAPRWSTL
jgi:hypothetical protein